jgi:hypothetical protein
VIFRAGSSAPGEQPARKPHPADLTKPIPVCATGVETPVSRKPLARPKIPASRYARIRTWVKYGMTAADVAQVYGVAVEEIERILAKA